MIILSIESSCDETAAAVTENGRRVLSSEINSHIEITPLYGGGVPELASRSHIQAVQKLADLALWDAGVRREDIDAVAVTYAPGLIGAVLVGVSFAKSAALALGKPLVPVHHIRGHVAANYIAYPELEPPFACLVASGGSSLILDVRGYTDYRVLGSTRDDAAGECFDKAARVLGIGYPGGAQIDALARTGDPVALSPAPRQGGGAPLRHVLLRPEDRGGEPGPQRQAERADPGSAGPGRLPLQGGERYPRLPRHGGCRQPGLREAGHRRGRFRQYPPAGRPGGRLRSVRTQSLLRSPLPLRRQRRHDRLPGLL